MTPERWHRITGLFHAARARDSASRGDFLDAACGGDQALRAEVNEMLLAHAEADGFSGAVVLGDQPTDSDDAAARPLALPPGARLGSYEVLALLGSGGMGEVYAARHRKLDRKVAIKVLRSDLAADAERRRRFEREARSASSLNHRNIVTIHDVAEQEGTHYIAMELIDGETLRERLRKGSLEFREIARIGAQIAEGLAKAHDAGIVHRDLKPENLMIDASGLVKILDFGLAKLMPERAGTPEVEKTEDTRRGAILGTVPYMSPEQASGLDVDHRSDQFSFGSILLEMATGRRAFERGSAAQTLAAIIEGEPAGLGQLGALSPPRFRSILRRCFAKDPAGRFDRTRELAEALSTLPATGRAPRPARTTASRAAAALAIVLALATLVGVASRPRVPTTYRPLSIQSIAVLPLRNLSGKAEQQAVVDGVTKSVIAGLTRLGRLRVVPPSSVMTYRGTEKSLAEVARELGADAILEGSAQPEGERIRVMVQLVDPRSGRALWAESYERARRDVIDLQDEVARAVERAVLVPPTE